MSGSLAVQGYLCRSLRKAVNPANRDSIYRSRNLLRGHGLCLLVLEVQSWQKDQGCGIEDAIQHYVSKSRTEDRSDIVYLLPECDAESPDGLALHADGASGSSPVPEVELAGLDGRHQVLNKVKRGVGIVDRRGVADTVAVDEGERLADGARHNDEGNQEQTIKARHDKEAKVSLRHEIGQ